MFNRRYIFNNLHIFIHGGFPIAILVYRSVIVQVIHPRSLTWPLKNHGWNTRFLLRMVYFQGLCLTSRGYLSFQGGNFMFWGVWKLHLHTVTPDVFFQQVYFHSQRCQAGRKSTETGLCRTFKGVFFLRRKNTQDWWNIWRCVFLWKLSYSIISSFERGIFLTTLIGNSFFPNHFEGWHVNFRVPWSCNSLLDCHWIMRIFQCTDRCVLIM